MTRFHKISALFLEALESRHAPAKLLSPSALMYQDKDGDTVTVSFSKSLLATGSPNTIFTFDAGPGAVNGNMTVKEQLQRIDLSGVPAAAGTAITVQATRDSTNGGDGYAAVGEIIATGIDLGAVKVDGDLGRVLAGDNTLTTPGVKALTVLSMGRYQTSTGATDVHSLIKGKVSTLKVKSDISDAELEVQGGVNGSIGAMTVGGSLIGSSGPSSGVIKIEGILGKSTIRGDVVGGSGMPSGYVGAGTIVNLTVGGNVIGGSATGNANLVASGFIGADHIKALIIGGSLIAGTDNTTGLFTGNGIVFAIDDIGSLTIKGSVFGNATNLAVISAGGQQFPSGSTDRAIGSVTVKGRVEHGLIEAGRAPDGNFNFVPVNADAQIGAITVSGDWIASSITAGTVSGGDGFFGTLDDAKMVGAGVKDDPAVSSEVGTVKIGGQVLGSFGGNDHYGIVAEHLGVLSVGGTVVSLAVGKGNDDLAIGITGDFTVVEI